MVLRETTIRERLRKLTEVLARLQEKEVGSSEGSIMDFFEWAGLFELYQEVLVKIRRLERPFKGGRGGEGTLEYDEGRPLNLR